MITRILLLYTGGTIGMAPKDGNDPDSPLAPQPLAALLQAVPAFQPAGHSQFRLLLAGGNAIQLGCTSLDPVDSSCITPQHWRDMAQAIAREYENYDGFVILHGTDTMAYTASALCFMLENLAKPVILTGAQLPIAAARSDALANLVNAIHVAGYRATGLPLIAEVAIVFGERILRGCRASKISTERWNAFESPNYPLLGRIGEQISIHTPYLRPPAAEGELMRVNDRLEEKVGLLYLFPGMPPLQWRSLLLDDSLRGIVILAYGAGNIPADNAALLAAIEQAAGPQGKLLVAISQCANGRVALGQYEASSALPALGVLSGADLTPEAAVTKLMWLLGNASDEECRVTMQVSLRGEQTENCFEHQHRFSCRANQ